MSISEKYHRQKENITAISTFVGSPQPNYKFNLPGTDSRILVTALRLKHNFWGVKLDFPITGTEKPHPPHAGLFARSHWCSGPRGEESWATCRGRSLPAPPGNEREMRLASSAVIKFTGANKLIKDTHLADFDWCAAKVGNARQRAALPTLGVRDDPAVAALQWNLPKLDPLSTGNAGFRLNDLEKPPDRSYEGQYVQ